MNDWASKRVVPPIISPYPASSYHTLLHTHLPSCSSVVVKHPPSSTALLSSPTNTGKGLFKWKTRFAPTKRSNWSQNRRVEKQQQNGHFWKSPVRPQLHLPALSELMALPSPSECESHQEESKQMITYKSICNSPSASTSFPQLMNGIFEYTPAFEDSLGFETGEDAIAYFSRYGSSSTLKYVYANRVNYDAKTGEENKEDYRPYELRVVSAKSLNPREFFTISSTGLIHIAQGFPTEVLTLQQWSHASHLFALLRAIPFFKHYLIAKAFRSWKANVRYRVFCTQRHALASQLFLARPSFCGPLLEIASICDEMSNSSIMHVRQGGYVYSVDSFMKDQHDARYSGLKSLEALVESMETKVDSVCRGVKDRARLFDHRIANEELSHSRFAQHLMGASSSEGGTKAQSMVKAKKEKRDRLRQLTAANEEADRLGDFIRLVDVMHAETLYEKAISDLRGFLSFLLNSTKPLFGTCVSFGEGSTIEENDGLEYQPRPADISSMLVHSSDLSLACFDSLPRLPSHPKFAPFIVSTRSSTNSPSNDLVDTQYQTISSIVREDLGYARMIDSVQTRVQESFVGVHESLKFLAKYRVIAEYGQKLQANESTENIEDVSVLTQDMAQLMTWTGSLQHIRDLYSFKVCQADLRPLKLALMPVCELGQQKIKDKLVTLFLERCDFIISNYQQLILQCKDEPVILSQYVDFILNMEKVKSEEANLVVQLGELLSLHDLLKLYNIYGTLSPADQIKYDEAVEYKKHFQENVLESVKAKIDGKSEEMKNKIIQEIKRSETALEQWQRAFEDNALYTDFATSIKDVNASLDVDTKRLKEISKRIDELNRQQSVLDDAKHNYKLLPIATEKLERKRAIFANLESWRDKEKKQLAVELDRLDIDILSQAQSDWSRAITTYCASHSHSSSNTSERVTDRERKEADFVKMLRSEVAIYQTFLPVLTDLKTVLQKIGPDGYKAAFLGVFGHVKRVKDLKKLDWANNVSLKTAVSNKIAELNQPPSGET